VCRCTGYVKIVAAVEAAARGDVSSDALQSGAPLVGVPA
jgi:xanthine dehydrogenase iron-sulfur cluster and FAD-binding subunit A